MKVDVKLQIIPRKYFESLCYLIINGEPFRISPMQAQEFDSYFSHESKARDSKGRFIKRS